MFPAYDLAIYVSRILRCLERWMCCHGWPTTLILVKSVQFSYRKSDLMEEYPTFLYKNTKTRMVLSMVMILQINITFLLDPMRKKYLYFEM